MCLIERASNLYSGPMRACLKNFAHDPQRKTIRQGASSSQKTVIVKCVEISCYSKHGRVSERLLFMMTNTARTLDVITLNFAENPPANFANTTGNTPPMVLRFSMMMTGWKICFSCLPNRLHLTLEKRKNCETVDIWRDLTN